jgi:amino acid transporter
MNVASIGKYIALIVLGVLALTASTGDVGHFTPTFSHGIQLSLLATALIPIMWTYDGWADASFIGGEVKNPQRTMPLALMIGTTLVVIVYLTINIGFIHLLPIAEMANAKLIGSKAAERIPVFGAYGAAIIAGLVVVSTFSGLNGSMMAGPRIFFAMADRGLFFKTVARVSPRFQSPSVAIWLATALGVAYALQNDFAQLADKFILGIWPFYALSVAAVFVLRKKRPDMPRPYRTWGYPVVPILFLVASFGMVLNALWTNPYDTGITFGIILAGVPIYQIWMRRRNRAQLAAAKG